MTDVAAPAEAEGRPDPAMAGTAEEFAAALQRLKSWAGVGFRQLEKRAAAAGESLPRSTMTAVLARGRLPREELLATFVRSCGCDEAEVRRWVAARRRIAAGSPSSGPAAPPPGGQPAAVPAPMPARYTLPADQVMFVGRDKELEQVAVAVADAAQVGGVIAIHAIDGMPGVGKTTLAVRAAHRLRDQFGDRQLFIDLHAHTPGQPPARPGDALADLLTADGLDPRFLPAAVEGRAALWRDRMAGRRVLLVLDNAASTEQVAPLLPGSPGCLVLVTSRRSLGDLPAMVPISLDVLTPDEAVAMFSRLAPRAAAEQAAVAGLVRECGYLPLAIKIMASLYLRHRSWRLHDLVREVHRSTGALLTVSAENRTVAAVFALSYQDLSGTQQRLFRLLGLHPGSEFDAYATAALAGIPLAEAVEHLDRLHGDHLLEEPGYRRYRMHDLIRAYANGLATATDPVALREQAVGRLLAYYEHTAMRADAHVALDTRPTRPIAPPADAPELATWEQAAGWLRTERANLFACIHHTATTGQDAHTLALAAGLAGLLRIDGPWPEAIGLHQAAAAAADRLGDRYAYATAVRDLGVVRRLAGEYAAAADLYRQALDLCRVLGDRSGEAHTLYALGVVRRLTGDGPGSTAAQRQALDLYQALGDRRGQATVLNELAAVRWATGDYPAAADLYQQALDMYQALGDRRGQATAILGLGVVRELTGDYPAAASLYERALALYQALSDPRGEAMAICDLGIVRGLTGDYPAAADLLDHGFHLNRALGNRLGQANALNDLGAVLRSSGDYPAALDLARRALDMFRAIGDRHGEATASTRLAVVKYLTGSYADAADLLHKALAVLEEIGARDDEAEALNHLGNLHRLTGQPGRAHTLHQRALDIACRIHHRLEEGRARHGIARAALQQGDPAAAATNLRSALRIYEQLGVPEAAQATADLAALDRDRLPQ